jgi:hypothetical protein
MKRVEAAVAEGRHMPMFAEYIFTEPADVDPDTQAYLGPLRRLAGSREVRKGVDPNPKIFP